MKMHVNQLEVDIEVAQSTFMELFQKEIRHEIEYLKNKISELEVKLEDPFG